MINRERMRRDAGHAVACIEDADDSADRLSGKSLLIFRNRVNPPIKKYSA